MAFRNVGSHRVQHLDLVDKTRYGRPLHDIAIQEMQLAHAYCMIPYEYVDSSEGQHLNARRDQEISHSSSQLRAVSNQMCTQLYKGFINKSYHTCHVTLPLDRRRSYRNVTLVRLALHCRQMLSGNPSQGCRRQS